MIIVGTNYVVRINNQLVGCEVGFTLKVQANEIQIAGRNYDFDEFISTTKSATLEFNGYFDPLKIVNANTLFDWINFGTLLDFHLDDLDSTDNNYYFQGRIVDWQITANTDEFARFNASVRISGRIEREPSFYLIDTDDFFVIQTDNISKIIITS